MTALEACWAFDAGVVAFAALLAARWAGHRLIDWWAARYVRREREAWSRRYGKGPHGD